MTQPPRKKNRWRWVRRGAAAAAILLILLLAIPFLFPTAVARCVIARTAYAQFSPQIASASLSPSGELALKDVVLHEANSTQVLLKAEKLDVTFSWRAVIGGTVKDITADNVTFYLRPGKSGQPAVTLMELASLPGPQADPQALPPQTAAMATIAAPTAPSKPFWFDHLSVHGTLNVERLEDWNAGPASDSLTLLASTHGDPWNPARDFTLNIGKKLTATLHLQPTTDGQQIRLDNLNLYQVNAGIGAALAGRIPPSWPATLRQPLTMQAQAISISGVVNRGTAATTFTARVTATGINAASAPDAKHKAELKALSFSASANGPLTADFLRTGTIDGGQVSLQSLVMGKNTLQDFSAAAVLADGTLNASAIKGIFAGGTFDGTVNYSAATQKLVKSQFNVQHIDQAILASNIAPDKIDATGTLSGTIALASGDKSALTGKIDLTCDGPGRLKIKDQAVAQALADKLQGTNAAGILPANFSDIVVGQLKDYPYKTGRLRVADHDGVPVLSLDYTRDNVQDGEPGFGIQTTIAGQKVRANYTIQLPGVTIVLKGQTIEELLATASGLQQQITGTGK